MWLKWNESNKVVQDLEDGDTFHFARIRHSACGGQPVDGPPHLHLHAIPKGEG